MARREFEIEEDNNKIVKLAVRNPQYEEREESDRVYAGKVASLIRDKGNNKLLLRQEVEDYIRKYNIWTTEDEKTIEKLQKEVDVILNKVRKGGDKLSQGRKLCIEAMDKRIEIVKLSRKKQVLYETTIESIAESEKIDYMVYICTVYADTGKNYWQSFEDMKNDRASTAYGKAVTEVMDVVFGVNNEFEKRLPENRWLKKYGFIDEDLNYTDRKTGKKVDRSGNSIEKAQEETVKQILNLQGTIEEEKPFIDDETGEEVIIKEKEEETDKEESAEENKEVKAQIS